jgi:L-fuculose-phosphate aldolase
MTRDEAISQLLSAHSFFEIQGAGYKNWGNVNVLQMALRVSGSTFLLTNEKKPLNQLTAQDIETISSSTSVFQQIFAKRKNVNAILITHQQYASQVNEEIPAILDDQAQLLGISIRVARTDNDTPKALSGRFAAVLPKGKSICIGATIDDAYVAAQLLEKTTKVFLEAKYLGGAKPINKIEAWFMQQYYQFKYSKEAVKNR